MTRIQRSNARSAVRLMTLMTYPGWRVNVTSSPAASSSSGRISGSAEDLSLTALRRLEAIDRLAAFVDAHLTQALTLEELAGAVAMSKFHLHRVLLAQTGLTPGQFVAVARLQTAMARLVGAGARPVKVIDVAMSVGFDDASAFSRCFRRAYGVRPRDVLHGAPPASEHLVLPDLGFALPSARAEVAHLSPFYAYGHEAVGGAARTFAREAPLAFAATFEAVQHHGIENVEGTLAMPSGQPWARPGERRLLCAFRSDARLSLPRLTETAIPGGAYLTLRHIGPHESRWQSWLKLAAIRLPLLRSASPNGGGERKPFELDRAPTPSGIPVTDIYFPISLRVSP